MAEEELCKQFDYQVDVWIGYKIEIAVSKLYVLYMN